MATVVYGIPNCDTVKKTRRWLDDNGIEYEFHDYKKVGVRVSTLKTWCEAHGYEALLNKRGTTWRKLEESDKEDMTEDKAIKLMQLHTSLIKRPVTEHENSRLIGFDEPQYVEVFE